MQDKGGADKADNGPTCKRPNVEMTAGNTEDFQMKTNVTFKDNLCGIDRKEGKQASILPTPSSLKSLRFYVVLLGLLTPFVVSYSKCIIYFAITDMIDPEFANQNKSPKENSMGAPNHQNQFIYQSAYFDFDNSCPVDTIDRERLLGGNKRDIKRAHSKIGEKFQWDTVQQGMLKGAYSFGFAPFAVVGGRLSEIYGSHSILGINTVLIALSCLLAPFLAQLHFYLLFADLVLLGVLGSFMAPALVTLFANWLTPGEKSMTLTILITISRLGYVLSSLLCGILIEAHLSWRYVFFSAGWMALASGALILLLIRSRPLDHPFIGKIELDYLAAKNALVREALVRQDEETASAKLGALELKVVSEGVEENRKERLAKHRNSAPWLAILTNPSVLAYLATKFCLKIAGGTVQVELPVYLSRVMHFTAKENGILNAWNYAMFCTGSLLVGILSKILVKKQPFGLSKTAIRKIFQCTSTFGLSLMLIGLATSACNNTWTRICLLIMFALSTCSTAGEAQIPLDITQRYSGTIHAIGSSLVFTNSIEATLVGFLLKGHAADRDRWSAVWIGASLIAFLGGLIFLTFSDASLQGFDSTGANEATKVEGKDVNSSASDQAKIDKADEAPHLESVKV